MTTAMLDQFGSALKAKYCISRVDKLQEFAVTRDLVSIDVEFDSHLVVN